MSYREATLLMRILVRDTESRMGAVLAEWKFPMSYEAMIAAYHADNYVTANAGKKNPKMLPRPWESKGNKVGGKTHLAQKDVRALLERRSQRKSEVEGSN